MSWYQSSIICDLWSSPKSSSKHWKPVYDHLWSFSSARSSWSSQIRRGPPVIITNSSAEPDHLGCLKLPGFMKMFFFLIYWSSESSSKIWKPWSSVLIPVHLGSEVAHLRSSSLLSWTSPSWSSGFLHLFEDFLTIYGSSEVGHLLFFVETLFCPFLFISAVQKFGFGFVLPETTSNSCGNLLWTHPHPQIWQ